MRVSVFTSNQPRHIALVEALAGIADEVFAVQECTSVVAPERSAVMQRYFARVSAAEVEVFGGVRFARTAGNVRTLALRMGDLSHLNAELQPALDADALVVFGASYIKGALCEQLVARRAINVHMGVSPKYRGSACNFWALYDGHPELVGGTLHRLSAGLDSGPMLCHALPRAEPTDPFVLGMKAVRAAHDALVEGLTGGRFEGVDGVPQERGQQLRYTRGVDFTDAIADEYLERAPTPQDVMDGLECRDLGRFVRPFVGC